MEKALCRPDTSSSVLDGNLSLQETEEKLQEPAKLMLVCNMSQSGVVTLQLL